MIQDSERKTMKLTLVAAINRNNVIGIDGKIPWHHKQDLKNFRKLTWGHIVIMGRNTFDSLPKPLPGRFNVVITNRKIKFKPNCAAVTGEFIEALSRNYAGEVFLMGGASLYRQCANLVSRIHLTVIDDYTDNPSAIYFPWEAFEGSSWKIIKQEQWLNATYIIMEKL